MSDLIKLRRDTAANWTAANPVLAAGEPGAETDTGKLKVGNGSTAWTSLPYLTGAVSGLTDSDVAAVAPNDQTGTTYTLVLADKHRTVTASNAAAQTYTVPPNSSVAYPLGTVLTVVAKGAGQVTLAPGSGVTLNSRTG